MKKIEMGKRDCDTCDFGIPTEPNPNYTHYCQKKIAHVIASAEEECQDYIPVIDRFQEED